MNEILQFLDDAQLIASMEHRIDELLARASAAEARAAELEAALDAERAANAWRPVSTVPLEQEVLLLVCGEVYGPPGHHGHQWVCTYDAPFSGWRPNAPQEPTQ